MGPFLNSSFYPPFVAGGFVMPALQFSPDDGQARYYSERCAWFQPGEVAEWPEPPDPHWVPSDSPPVTTEPASVRKKGGDGQ